MGKPETDHELVDRVRNGHTEAFRTLVNRHKDPSFTLAVSILKDEAQAEDVLQEVFVKVYRSLGTFRGNSKFSTWLYRIVVNMCYNELARRKNVVSLTGEADAALNLPVARQNADLAAEDRKTYILKALDMLKPDEALVLRLFYLYELNLKEVEEVTCFKPEKIRVTLHRGRKRFKQRLEQLLGREVEDIL